MELLPGPIKLLLDAFVIAYMLSIGMETTRGEIKRTLSDSKLTIRALLANFIFMPVVGILLVKAFPFNEDTRIGLFLLALCPGGLFALNFARVSGGNIRLAVAMMFLLPIPAVVLVPLIAHFTVGATGTFGTMVRSILILLSLLWIPLFVGRAVAKYMSESQGKKLGDGIGTLSIVLFVCLTLLTASSKKPAMHAIGVNGLLCIALLTIAGWVVGWFATEPSLQDRKTMAIVTGMRNVTLCIPLAIDQFGDREVLTPIIAYSGLSIPMTFLFSFALKFLGRVKRTDQVDRAYMSHPRA